MTNENRKLSPEEALQLKDVLQRQIDTIAKDRTDMVTVPRFLIESLGITLRAQSKALAEAQAALKAISETANKSSETEDQRLDTEENEISKLKRALREKECELEALKQQPANLPGDLKDLPLRSVTEPQGRSTEQPSKPHSEHYSGLELSELLATFEMLPKKSWLQQATVFCNGDEVIGISTSYDNPRVRDASDLQIYLITQEEPKDDLPLYRAGPEQK